MIEQHNRNPDTGEDWIVGAVSVQGEQVFRYKDNIPEPATITLTATDYQVIKSYEYTLAGELPPYDITKLHSQRCELRDKINNLENKI